VRNLARPLCIVSHLDDAERHDNGGESIRDNLSTLADPRQSATMIYVCCLMRRHGSGVVRVISVRSTS